MVERFNRRIEEVLQSHHIRSGDALETTLDRYVLLYNQKLPQSALGSKTPLQAMKDWHKLKLDLFRKQPYHLPGCDSYPSASDPTLSLYNELTQVLIAVVRLVMVTGFEIWASKPSTIY